MRSTVNVVLPLAATAFLTGIFAACGGGGETGEGGASTTASSSSSSSSGTASSSSGSGGTGGAMVSATHPKIYLNAANKARLQKAIADGAGPATRFMSMVDGQLAGADYYAFSATDAALAYQLTGEQAYASYAIQMADAIVTSEEAKIAAGEVPEVAGDSYLYVGDLVGDVAVTYDWCFEHLTPQQKTRWIAWANQAVWNVWHPEQATWGGTVFPWSGWSIDNPSNNYYYSFLTATLYLGLATSGEAPESQTWIDTFRKDKIGAELLPTFDKDLVGGGSREGTGYGAAMHRLFHLYEVWEASTGERIADLTPHTLASLRYLIHATSPTLDRVAPIGDHARESTGALFDYHRDYAQELVSLFKTAPEAPVGKRYLATCSVPEMGQAFMFQKDLLYHEPSVAEAPLSSLSPVYHAPGTGHVFARSSWDASATWLTFIAGPYTESHAHQDQGSFTLFKGEWLAYDQNISSHSGIRQEIEMHNLVRLVDAGQTIPMPYDSTSSLTALRAAPRYTYLAADLTGAYKGDPRVGRVQRELVFLAPGLVVVFDRVDTPAGIQKVWQLNTDGAVTPVLDGVTVTAGGSELTLTNLHPAGAIANLVSWPAVDGDMLAGARVDITDTKSAARFLEVLSLDGAVAALVGADSGSQKGVTVTLASGEKATVRFEDGAAGGTLEIRDAGNAVLVSDTLAPGVAAIPVFAP